jgi:hypothetical protein
MSEAGALDPKMTHSRKWVKVEDGTFSELKIASSRLLNSKSGNSPPLVKVRTAPAALPDKAPAVILQEDAAPGT